MMEQQEIDIEKTEEEILQLAENVDVAQSEREKVENEYEKKREMLKKTKITKQTWSISEIYQKITYKKLILTPDYQRNTIWDEHKQTAFIESLYMGIVIPPIYVVEVPSTDVLEENKYEVVDGKQRLTAIMNFIQNKLCLCERNLEYFSDIYGGRFFSEIRELDSERTSQMLSSVLDVYVITANSPEFTKYDIFARLNKGAEKLKVNEIRRAIYKSEVTDIISSFVKDQIENNGEVYEKTFTKNDIKRYEDFGRFYRSIAFYLCSNIEDGTVEKYNSRPREMINNVLENLQKRKINIEKEKVEGILNETLQLKNKYGKISNSDYIIDAIIPFIFHRDINVEELAEKVFSDKDILETLKKSPSTTTNVDSRLKRVRLICEELSNE